MRDDIVGGVVDVVITDRAVSRFVEGQLSLAELMPGATLEGVRATTAAPFVEALGGRGGG